MYITIYATWKDTKEDFSALCKVGAQADTDADDDIFFYFEDENDIESRDHDFIVNGYEEI